MLKGKLHFLSALSYYLTSIIFGQKLFFQNFHIRKIRHKDFCSDSVCLSVRSSSRSGYPPWVLKRAVLESFFEIFFFFWPFFNFFEFLGLFMVFICIFCVFLFVFILYFFVNIFNIFFLQIFLYFQIYWHFSTFFIFNF